MQLISAGIQPSRLKTVGTLVIRVREAGSGRLIKTLAKRNTITYNAGDIVRAMLAQRATDPAAGNYALGSMRFGTSATAPTRYDTDLLAEVGSTRQRLIDAKKVDGVTGELTLQATLGTSEGNGNTLQEAALFTLGAANWDDPVGGTLLMFSRQVHAAVAKTVAITLDYNWTLQFTT